MDVKLANHVIQNKIKDFEKKLAGWSTLTAGATTGSYTIVVGGLADANTEGEAMAWADAQLGEHGIQKLVHKERLCHRPSMRTLVKYRGNHCSHQDV